MFEALVAGFYSAGESAALALKEAAAHIGHDGAGDMDTVNAGEGLAAEESSSGGAQAADKQRKLREQRREARRRATAHAEHDTRHFTKGMFWDSVKIQSMLLAPMFAASLALSAWLPEAFVGLDVVFVGLGAYIGFEMTEMVRHLRRRGHAPQPHKPVAQVENMLSPSAVFHRYKNNLTFKTCVEVGLGLIAGIHHLPLWQQLIIFPLCGGIMMVAPPLMTNTLLGIEHTGTRFAQKLRKLKPKNKFRRFVIKREWNVKLGNGIEDATIGMFDAMPWFGVLAKTVTCGRLVARGIEPIETTFKDYASNLLEFGLAWGATGAVVGSVVNAGHKAVTSAPQLARAAVLPIAIAAQSLPRRKDVGIDISDVDELKTPMVQRRIYAQKLAF